MDVGARFFTQYSAGATGTGGTLTIEWISFDPTLFGNFPAAVRTTQGMGAWRQVRAATYEYTWIAYGLDSAGIPAYSIKVSGSGALQDCDAIAFDYVMEIFPAGLDPLVDDPVLCVPGVGSKHRIPVSLPSCP